MKPNQTLTFRNFVKQETGLAWETIVKNDIPEIREYWIDEYKEECKEREITPIWEVELI